MYGEIFFWQNKTAWGRKKKLAKKMSGEILAGGSWQVASGLRALSKAGIRCPYQLVVKRCVENSEIEAEQQQQYSLDFKY